MPDEVLDRKLCHIVDSLMSAPTEAQAVEFLRALVVDIASQYERAPVQDYLEVLVLKEARQQLGQRTGMRPAA